MMYRHNSIANKGGLPLQRPSATVSARMSAVKQKHTAPELAVRRIVYSLGTRYRVCSRNIEGRPDISNLSQKWCIFVHGCFWHGHDCRRGSLPKVNLGFWAPKIARNRERDKEVARQLRTHGFRVLTVWQCALEKPDRLKRRIAHFLRVRVEQELH